MHHAYIVERRLPQRKGEGRETPGGGCDHAPFSTLHPPSPDQRPCAAIPQPHPYTGPSPIFQFTTLCMDVRVLNTALNWGAQVILNHHLLPPPPTNLSPSRTVLLWTTSLDMFELEAFFYLLDFFLGYHLLLPPCSPPTSLLPPTSPPSPAPPALDMKLKKKKILYWDKKNHVLFRNERIEKWSEKKYLIFQHSCVYIFTLLAFDRNPQTWGVFLLLFGGVASMYLNLLAFLPLFFVKWSNHNFWFCIQ